MNTVISILCSCELLEMFRSKVEVFVIVAEVKKEYSWVVIMWKDITMGIARPLEKSFTV